MNKLFVSENYIIAEVDGVEIGQYAMSKCVYTLEDSIYIIKEGLDEGQLLIAVADVADWYNEAGDTAYSSSTLLAFLREYSGKYSAGSTASTTEAAEFGSAISGRPVTATLYVSPDGDNTDGSTWAKAYTTIQVALDAASTDANDLTSILIAPHPTFYDIDTTGNPTWSANVEILAPHRRWAIIKNTHASATSIFKFTGKASIDNLAIVHAGTCNGVIFTQSSFRIRRCGINSTGATGAVKSVHLDGTAATMMGGIVEDVRLAGHVTHTTGFYLDNVSMSDFNKLDIHDSLNGVQIVNASSVTNFFKDSTFDGNALALNIDAGVGQHFTNVNFHGNTSDIDDEVGGHNWDGIHGEFPIYVTPESRTGTTVTSGVAVYGSDTELIAAAAIDTPFKVVSYVLDPSADETMLIRFSADSGTTYFAEDVFSGSKNKASGAGDATDFIFNKGTRISASLFASGDTRTVDIWLEIQEI